MLLKLKILSVDWMALEVMIGFSPFQRVICITRWTEAQSWQVLRESRFMDSVGHEAVDITYHYAHLFPTVQSDMAVHLDSEREELINVRKK